MTDEQIPPQTNLEEFFSVPAIALEKTVEWGHGAGRAIISKVPFRAAEEHFHTLGPGLTTGAADDDPSGIATYSQTGAQYGFQLVWLALFTFPLMALVQEMCARIALVTGQGLAANIRTHFPRSLLYTCTIALFAANVFNIGADLGAMAKAAQLLMPQISFGWLIIFFAGASLFLQVYTTYARYAKYLKYLTLSLFAYVITAFIVHIDWGTLMHATFIPSMTFSKDQIILVCAILGTTISPYLFFWQSSQEVEEEIRRGRTTLDERMGATKEEIDAMRSDVWSGMFFSNLVMYFIIAVCAAVLSAHGITDIQTADQAAEALRPLAGEWTYFLFAFGIIGTGMLAVPVLAGGVAYAVAEGAQWRQASLHDKLHEAHAFYGVLIVSMVIGLLMNFTGVNPIKALIYSAVANGLIAPIMLILIVLLSSDKRIMGEHVNNGITKTIGWITVVLMTIAGVAAIVSMFI